jgi:thiol-disulfide isomerase/thioredoxin
MRSFTLGTLLLGLALAPTLAHAQAQVGGKAPDIDLPTLAGSSMKLSALRGHPIIVTFWGTWCPPCREEFPRLVAAYEKYRGDGLEIIAVNQRDQELSVKDVKAFSDSFSVPFPIALDVRGRSRRVYRLIGLPTTVFIDTAGTIRQMQPGPVSEEALTRGLGLILKPR